MINLNSFIMVEVKECLGNKKCIILRNELKRLQEVGNVKTWREGTEEEITSSEIYKILV